MAARPPERSAVGYAPGAHEIGFCSHLRRDGREGTEGWLARGAGGGSGGCARTREREGTHA